MQLDTASSSPNAITASQERLLPFNPIPTDPTPHSPPGHLYFFRYTFDAPPYATAGVLSPSGTVEREMPLDLPRPVMMHDMAISENYMIFMDHPLCFDGEVRPGGVQGMGLRTTPLCSVQRPNLYLPRTFVGAFP